MPFCLKKEELEKLITAVIEKGDPAGDKSLELWIDHAVNWFDNLTGFTYFLAKLFEKKLKQGKTTEFLLEELDQVYLLPESMWFVLQEFDQDFIRYLLNSERDSILSLEDDLVQVQNKLSGFEYE